MGYKLQKLLVASISFLLLGFFPVEKVKATSYTHNLLYTTTDSETNATLSGLITFEDSHGLAQTNLGSGNDTNFSGFITGVTFTYNNDNLGSPLTLTLSNIESIRITHSGTTDYDGDPILYSQLSQLNFASDFNGSFTLNRAGLFAQNVDAEDDFLLNTTSYHSPAPLPLLGLLSAYSYMRKLKKRFKDQVTS